MESASQTTEVLAQEEIRRIGSNILIADLSPILISVLFLPVWDVMDSIPCVRSIEFDCQSGSSPIKI